jgi:uncharacterized protein YecE (DUF72 family)
MKLFCGTSGFSFKEWKGSFYPAKLPADEMLAFYASRLPTVEINNTFYRMPGPGLLEGWAAQVPESFRFAIKAPRRISHVKQLKDCAEEANHFFSVVAVLGARLGAVLVQLPPHARVSVEKLKEFLELVPAGIPVAFEFRHASWMDDAVFAALRAHGAARVTTDDNGEVPVQLVRTADWCYLRLRAPDYPEVALGEWKTRCESFDRAFVYFKHEDGAAGPAFAERMLKLGRSTE